MLEHCPICDHKGEKIASIPLSPLTILVGKTGVYLKGVLSQIKMEHGGRGVSGEWAGCDERFLCALLREYILADYDTRKAIDIDFKEMFPSPSRPDLLKLAQRQVRGEENWHNDEMKEFHWGLHWICLSHGVGLPGFWDGSRVLLVPRIERDLCPVALKHLMVVVRRVVASGIQVVASCVNPYFLTCKPDEAVCLALDAEHKLHAKRFSECSFVKSFGGEYCPGDIWENLGDRWVFDDAEEPTERG